MASTRLYSVWFHPRGVHLTDFSHPAVYAAVVQAGRVESQRRIEKVLVEMAVVGSVLVEQTTLIKSRLKEVNIMNKIVWINTRNGARIVIDRNSDKRNVQLFDAVIKELCYQVVR